jgi:hypothetical protein
MTGDYPLDKVREGEHYTLFPEYGWWFYSVEGGSMNKVNQYLFYEFGAALRPLRDLTESQTYMSAIFTVIRAQMALRKLLAETSHVPLRLSKSAANSLDSALDELIDVPKKKEAAEGEQPEYDWEQKIDAGKTKKVLKKLDELETVFSMEAVGLDVYAVTQKAGYSTDTLVQHGEEIIPEEIRDYMPEYALKELHEAGRCLVFDLPTAAGFHMMRSVESVLHSYWDVISGGKPRPTLQNGADAPMGTYINQVENEGADKIVTGVLKQIKDLHRNPLMHPDAVLNINEAIVLLGVVSSAIMAMAEEMKKKGANPASAALAPSAPASAQATP